MGIGVGRVILYPSVGAYTLVKRIHVCRPVSHEWRAGCRSRRKQSLADADCSIESAHYKIVEIPVWLDVLIINSNRRRA